MQHKEKYKIDTVNRNTISFADYNPRKLSKSAHDKLKRSIKKYGVLQPFVINGRTGNMVGGHQRLQILDEINGTLDYQINVAKIDVDEQEEIKINIVLNNQNAMGEFDPLKLSEINIMFPEIDFVNDLMFDQADIDIMSIQVPELGNITFEENNEAVKKSREQIIADRQTIRENNKIKDEEAIGNHIDRRDNFITIVFNTNKEKYEFMQSIGIDGNEKMLSFYKFKELYQNPTDKPI